MGWLTSLLTIGTGIVVFIFMEVRKTDASFD